jgi:dihydrolipoamide dehydrogenase
MKIAVIGGGPGGYVAAIRCAQYGGDVTLIEEGHLGGTCVNVGCIPTKALLKGIEPLSHWSQYEKMGLVGSKPSIQVEKLVKHTKKAIQMSRQGIDYLLKKNNIQWIHGRAIEVKDHTVSVLKEQDEISVDFDTLVLATGSSSSTIPGIEIDQEKIIFSDQALTLSEIPNNMVIIGGGVIGCEIATIYNQLGTNVTILEGQSQILPCEDTDAAHALQKSLQSSGIKIHCHSMVSSAIQKNGSVHVEWNQDDKTNTMVTDIVLMAIGRHPTIIPSLLDPLGIEYSRKGVVTTPYLETNHPDVYCIGDLNGKWMLAHTASREGMIAAARIFHKETPPIHYGLQPSVVFTHPELAGVGKRLADKTYTFPYSANGKARASGIRDGFVKIFVDDNALVGCTFFGAHASDMITLATMAIQKKLPLSDLGFITFPHPTFSEVFGESIEMAENMAIHM